VAKEAQEIFLGDLDDKYLPTFHSIRLILRAGLVFLGSFVLVYALLQTVRNFASAALYRALGGHTIDRFVLNESRLLADGDRVYSLYDDSTLSAAPGFVQDLDYLFEVDPAALDDLTLEVSQSEIVHGYQSRVQVHLGITPANAAAWRTAGQGRALEPDLDGSTRAVP